MSDLSPVDRVAERVLDIYRGWGRDTPHSERRRDWDNLFINPSTEERLERFSIESVPAAWVRPRKTAENGALLYVHGGGFQVGSITSHAELAARICDQTGMPTLIIDYCLAPESQFPEALDDTLAAYHFLLEQGFDHSRIGLIGDSAGANLILGAVLSILQNSENAPGALALLSPWTDMQLRGASYETRADVDPIHQRSLLERTAAAYLGKHDPADPIVSPLNASLEGFPPTLIQVGDRETVLSDAEDFAHRLSEHGVECEFQNWPNMIHVFQQFPEDLVEAREAVANIADFIKTKLGEAK